VDCFDNAQSRELVSRFAKKSGKALVHAAVSGDGTFGLVRWDERFKADAEDTPGQATCEGGEHLPLLGLLASTLARTIQDFVSSRQTRDSIVSLQSVLVSST
jgi:hypothetical protein